MFFFWEESSSSWLNRLFKDIIGSVLLSEVIGLLVVFLRIVLVREVVFVNLLLLLWGLKLRFKFFVLIRGGKLLLVWGWIGVVGVGVGGVVWVFYGLG